MDPKDRQPQTNVDPIRARIRHIIVDHLQIDGDAIALDADSENFLQASGMSSIDALELLLRVEEEFEIEIADDDLNADLIVTLTSIAEYVRDRLIVKGSGTSSE